MNAAETLESFFDHEISSHTNFGLFEHWDNLASLFHFIRDSVYNSVLFDIHDFIECIWQCTIPYYFRVLSEPLSSDVRAYIVHCTCFGEMRHSEQILIEHRLWIFSDCFNIEYEYVVCLSFNLRYPAFCTGLKSNLRNRPVCILILFVYDLLNIMFNLYSLRIKYLAN